VNLPNGVATTADAYRYFLEQAGLNQGITDALHGLDVTNVHDLAKRGAAIRDMIVAASYRRIFKTKSCVDTES
jgi:pyruvate,water dikinase